LDCVGPVGEHGANHEGVAREGGPRGRTRRRRAAHQPHADHREDGAEQSGVRDALEGMSAEVLVMRSRDVSESSRRLLRRRFTR